MDPEFLWDKVKDFYDGRKYLGRWEKMAEEQRWGNLAKKLWEDREFLDDFVEGDARIPLWPGTEMILKCRIAINIRLTKARFFKKLEGPEEWELHRSIRRANGQQGRLERLFRH